MGMDTRAAVAGLAGLLLSAAAGAEDFRFVEGTGYLDLMDGDRQVLRHVTAWDPKRHSETFKTFHHVYGFHGEGTLTKGPGGQFTHHRGLFLGWSKTATAGKEMDSWHGGNASSTRHARYLPERELTGPRARRAAVTEWTERDNTVIVRDTREVTATIPEAGKLQLDWAITIASATGDTVRLDGDPQHAGFQFRADSTITTPFEYLGPADKTGTGDVWTMKNANSWALQKFALQGHGYAVMQMDHPKNPRPVVVSHRDYGRFGHYFTAVIPPDRPLTFWFRTLVLDTDRHGAPTQAAAQAIYDEFSKVDPTVSLAPGTPWLAPMSPRTLRLDRSASGLLLPERWDLQGRGSAAYRAAGISILKLPTP